MIVTTSGLESLHYYSIHYTLPLLPICKNGMCFLTSHKVRRVYSEFFQYIKIGIKNRIFVITALIPIVVF